MPAETHQDDTAFQKNARSSEAIGTNQAIVETAAKTVRRMKADEGLNAEGVRTIWHRGRSRTEMLSWELENEVITRQELSFFGLVIEFESRTGIVRTGHIPHDESEMDVGKQMIHLVEFDAQPNQTILDYASRLLRNIPGRDFYAQHLLKHTNLAISREGFDSGRTAVSNVNGFARDGAAPLSVSNPALTENTNHTSFKVLLPLIVMALVGAALGIGVGLFVLK